MNPLHEIMLYCLPVALFLAMLGYYYLPKLGRWLYDKMRGL